MSSSKGITIRERYEAACESYDELYRAEQYEKYYVALRKVKPHGVVLDAGCGTALLAEFLRGWGLIDEVEAYICLDYSGCMLRIASWKLGVLCSGNCYMVMGDVERLPLRDNVADVAYAFTVLDLLEDPLRGLEELSRVTRGSVVVSVLKTLGLKDKLIEMGFKILGVTSKDVIFKVK